ncbi:MAG: divergent polysaccharide deacetylase family protein, partial [Rhodobacteraceae bacterium]|nr:divergent polysaccharide deacetylase family protein [Paracoccaceae bacterium]
MSSEDLTAPLGLGKRRFIRLPFGLIGTGLISVLVATVVIWVAVVDNPLGGEPVALVPLEDTVRGLASRDIEVVEIRPSLENELGPNLRNGDGLSGLGPRYELQQTADGAGIEALINTDPRVSERTNYGFLPKISSEGVRPLDAYARPFSTEFASIPKIAIVVTGLGLSSTGSQNALDSLPLDV